jgi:hypothetical protein
MASAAARQEAAWTAREVGEWAAAGCRLVAHRVFAEFP